MVLQNHSARVSTLKPVPTPRPETLLPTRQCRLIPSWHYYND
jgi:hypothetical protein